MQQPRLITALITPFLNGEVDVEGLKTNIAYQLEHGVEAILVLGTTGESASLTNQERQRVITTAVVAAAGRAPVFVGTGTNATQSTIEWTNEAEELGADAALIVTPYYNCPTQEGIYQHFAAVANATKLPICIYNIPKRTGRNIDVETLLRISRLPRIIGVKESTGDLNQCAAIMQQIANQNEQFKVWCGDDTLLLPFMSLGCQGLISVASNLIPEEISTLVRTVLSEDYHMARERFFALVPLLHALFIETNPIPIKAAMEMCGMPSGSCRLPLSALLPENRQKLWDAINEYGMISQLIRS